MSNKKQTRLSFLPRFVRDKLRQESGKKGIPFIDWIPGQARDDK